MADIKKAYCEYCDEDIEPVRTIENTAMDIEGVKFTFDKIIDRCPECNKEVYVQDANEENVQVAHELYIKHKELAENK